MPLHDAVIEKFDIQMVTSTVALDPVKNTSRGVYMVDYTRNSLRAPGVVSQFTMQSAPPVLTAAS